MGSELPAFTEGLRPTRWNIGLVLVLSTLAYSLPQEIALQWYPIGDPGPDILQLELACQSDREGTLQLLPEFADRAEPEHAIVLPIQPSQHAITYTFPLADAPLTALSLSVVGRGATLSVASLRIVERGGRERFRVDRSRVQPVQEIQSIASTSLGWAIVSHPSATAPLARIYFPAVAPTHYTTRNLERCLGSIGYLSAMLWLVLLGAAGAMAPRLAIHRLLGPAAYLGLIAVCFGIVGNRRLIEFSLRAAKHAAPSYPRAVALEFDLTSSGPSPTQLFWDAGHGINGQDSHRLELEPHTSRQTVRFPLPSNALRALRYDPRDNAGWVMIHAIRLVSASGETLATIPLDSLWPEHEILKLFVADSSVRIETTPHASDPIASFQPATLRVINSVIRGQAEQNAPNFRAP